jgi:hypothetical protein
VGVEGTEHRYVEAGLGVPFVELVGVDKKLVVAEEESVVSPHRSAREMAKIVERETAELVVSVSGPEAVVVAADDQTVWLD